MTVKDLIEELRVCDPDAEVRLAMQPSLPMDYTIGQVLECGSDGSFGPEDPERKPDAKTVVFIGEGEQVGYLNDMVASGVFN